jgi:hypothetical protein
MRRFNQADRNRDKLRSSANWQATEALLFQGSLDYSTDDYKKSVYGLQRATQWALNLDGSYALGDDMSIGLFTSFETQRTRFAGNTYTANSAATAVNGATAIDGGCYATIALRNANNKIDPCLNWQTTMKDKTSTLGASFTKSKLLAGKLSLQGSVVYSDGRTDIDVVGGNYVNNPFAGVAGNPTSAIAAYFIPASALPTITAKSLDFRLSGTYKLRADSALRFAYGYQHLTSYDWGYEGSQDGGLTQVLPTREQAPHYTVHSIGISYVMTFR